MYCYQGQILTTNLMIFQKFKAALSPVFIDMKIIFLCIFLS